MRKRQGLTRRQVVQVGGAAALATVLVRPAHSTPAEMRDAIAKITGKAPVSKGKVKLDIPPLSENGNSVTCTVSVDSPMTPTNYVKAIHIFNERNPQPNVIGVHLGPRAGRARFTTRIRLNDTQSITAIAQLSDGTFWSASADVIVTLGACLEDPV